MPDQRSVLKEYRALEQKRLAQGLTPVEDRRHAELKALVGPEASGGSRGGFDVNAAAARLRESLLPAGLRNRPPPTPELVEPEQLAPELEPTELLPAPEPAALQAAWEEQPFAPLETPQQPADALFDPSSLGAEGEQPAYDPNAAQQAWDPNQPWDASQQQGYDPNAAWDPNAPPLEYDPNAAPPQAYDPNAQPYDAGAQQAGWDPNQAWDASQQQGYDPNAAWDPNAPPQEYDPNAAPQEYDPNATPADAAWDPASLSAEPAAAPPPGEAAPFDGEFAPATDAAGAQGDWSTLAAAAAPQDGASYGGEPGPELEDPYAVVPGAELAPEAAPAEPEPALAAEPAAFPEGWDPAVGGAEPPPPGTPLGEYDAAGPGAFVVPGEGTELPFDAAAASAIHPAQLPEGYEAVPGEYDDNAGFGVNGLETPAAIHLDDSAAHPEAPSWQPDAALDQGFELASGGSFDAAADARSPEWAGAAPEAAQPWQGGELTEPEPEPDLGAPVELDRSRPDLSGGDDAADDFFAISAPPLALGGPASPRPAAPAPPPGPPPGLRAPAAPPAPRPAPAPLAPEPPPSIDDLPELEAEEVLEAVELGEPIEHPEPEPAPLPPLDLGELGPEPGPAGPEVAGPPVEHLEPDAIEVEEIIHADDGLAAPPELDFPTTIAEPFPPAPPPAAYAEAAAPEVAPEPEPIPEAPPPAAEPVPEPAPEEPPLAAEDVAFEEAAPSSVVPGVHRVVVHTLEGLVKRGVLSDADLAAPVLGLAPAQGAEPEVLGADKVKAIFFMLAPGEAPPTPEGQRVRVTFKDGRQVAGFSPDYTEGGIGFFMIPADTRTNTGRIWIYRAAVKQVTVG